MTHQDKIANFLDKQGVGLPVSDFIALTSNIYHKFESTHYDDNHVSIQLAIPGWNKTMKALATLFAKEDSIHVLDFGCGTGFATEQILSSQIKEKCGHLTCYDLSPDMVAVCRAKFGDIKNMSFLSNQDGLQQLLEEKGKFDLILCNAVLHHILEIEVLFPILINLLKPNGVIVLGHEPNKRFYTNGLLTAITTLYRWVKRIDNKLMRFIRIRSGAKPLIDMSLLTYNELLSRGIIKTTFPLKMIPKLIDIHVPLSSFKKQPWGELGFDAAFFGEVTHFKLQVENIFSYNHIKDQQAYSTWLWMGISKLLAFVYPKDGADAIFILKEKS